MTQQAELVRVRTRAVVVFTALVLLLIAFFDVAWAIEADAVEIGNDQGIHRAWPGPDSTDWVGLAAVESQVRTSLSELWQVSPDEMVLEFGPVRTTWVPGPELNVELRGTGRGGQWIVAASDPAGSVSIRLKAGFSVLRTVAVRPLARGHVVTEDDITLSRMAIWGIEDLDADQDVIGWVARRAVGSGDLLEPPTVEPPAAVTSGTPVKIELTMGSVGITMMGTALGTVPIGGTVYVRTSSGERLQGEAIAPGRVRILSGSRE